MQSITPKHPREFIHEGQRVVAVPVRVYWNCNGESGAAEARTLAIPDDEKRRFMLMPDVWIKGNFACDCQRLDLIGLRADHFTPTLKDDNGHVCGFRVNFNRIESLDPLVPSLPLDEPVE